MACCREIHVDDIDSVIALLRRGFGREHYWPHAMRRLADHPTPAGLPKYGYVLEHDGALVGVILLIFTDIQVGGKSHIRCNVSSWYVEPAYRSYGSMLATRAMRHKNVTYFNVTPAPHTWLTLDALGFKPFASGRTIAIPALSRSPADTYVSEVTSNTRADRDLDQAEIDVLLQHKGYGCLSLTCEAGGHRYPFVFTLERKHGLLRIAQLVYARDLNTFVHLAGPIGRFLARRGCFFVKFLSSGPTPGIVGRHADGRPKYRKGGDQIHVADIAYSEEVVFGNAEHPMWTQKIPPIGRQADNIIYRPA